MGRNTHEIEAQTHRGEPNGGVAPPTHVPTDTVWRRVGASTDDAARWRDDYGRGGAFNPVAVDTPDGDPVLGLAVTPDFRAQEERGVMRLHQQLTGPNPRRTLVLPGSDRLLTTLETPTVLMLSTTPPRTPPTSWEQLLDRRSRELWWRMVPLTRGQHRSLSNYTVAQLRELARRHGVSPLPRRKDELVAVVAAHYPMLTPDQWPHSFPGGSTLLLRADDGPTQQVLSEVASAARRGTLGVDLHDGRWQRGLLLYDTDDETPGLVADREAREDWRCERLAELLPVARRLELLGYRWHHLGSPQVRTHDGEQRVCYWLDPVSSCHSSGWYTLDELAAERFVEDPPNR